MGEISSLLERLQTALGKLRAGDDPLPCLDEALAAISEDSGCESVGIRWRAGEDYPYYATRGFGREFVIVEGPLCVRDSAGLTLRHPDGTPQLACLCGAVILGRTDPALPWFTGTGSFWTNTTGQLVVDEAFSPLGSARAGGRLGEAGPEHRRRVETPPSTANIRNYCNAQGYESVALIPLRAGGETLGLLQLNSRRPGRFTGEQIARYEVVAREIAAALVTAIGRSVT